MTRSSPFVLIALPIAAGIWLASQFPMPAWLPALVCCVGLLAMLGAWRLRSAAETIWTAAFCALVAFGALRYNLSAPFPSPQSIARYNGQPVTLEGVIIAEPDVRPTHINLRVQPWRISGAFGTDNTADDVVLIRVAAESEATKWRYGDAVRAVGLLDAPPRMTTFDYREYLARQGVFSWMRQPRDLQRIGAGYGDPFVARLLDVRDAVRQVVRRILPRSEAALLNGILIGDAKDLPEAVRAAFQRAGVSHIVAISGFNVSIVIALVIPLLGRLLSPRRAAVFAIPVIWLYAAFVGGSASVVRAVVMASIGLFGALWWRKGFTLNTLCAAACAMLIHDPQTLFDLGFQLSFTATLGLVIYADRLAGRVRDWVRARVCNEYVQRVVVLILDGALVTLAAQLTTLPLILAIFEMFSNVVLLANVLILPLQPPIMILGSFAALVGLVLGDAMGQIAALPAYLVLTTNIRIITWLSDFEWAVIPVYGFGPPAVLAYYVGLLVFTAFMLQPADWRRAAAELIRTHGKAAATVGTAAIAIVLGSVYWFQRPDGKLHVTLLGGSAFIQSPSGRQAAFVGGGDVAALLGRTMPVYDREIDLLIVPQRDERNRTDALSLLRRYRVATLVVPPGDEAAGESLTEWRYLVATNVGRILTATPSLSLTLDTDVSVVIALRAPGRDGLQAIGAQLIHRGVVVDLVGNYEAIGYPAGAGLIFLGPARADIAALNDARPRWVVWADAPGLPPSDLDWHIRAVNLKDIGQVTYTSDGTRLIVRGD